MTHLQQCSLQPPCRHVNIYRLVSIKALWILNFSDFSHIPMKQPPSCFIQQSFRINHITALPLIFLSQSKQVLKCVESMGGIWIKSQLMKNVKLKKKSAIAFLYISCQDLFTQCERSPGKCKVGTAGTSHNCSLVTKVCSATQRTGSVRIPPSHFYSYATYNYWQGH